MARCSRWISCVENRSPRYERVCSGLRQLSRVFRFNAPIYFNSEAGIIPRPNLIELPNFLVGIGDELLSAEAWVDGHHQYGIQFVEHFAEHPHRGSRINCRARFRAEFSDH